MYKGSSSTCSGSTISENDAYALPSGVSIHSPEYAAWEDMVARCCNHSHPLFVDFGGAGTRVCEEWRCCFSDFYHDMGKMPGYRCVIERKDCAKPYSKANCRWALAHQLCFSASNIRLTPSKIYPETTVTPKPKSPRCCKIL